MPASWELQLISAIVRADSPAEAYESAQKRGIRPELFGTIEAKTIWARIDAHYTRVENFGHIPSEEYLREIFPAIDLPTPLDNFGDLCSRVRDGYVRRRADALIEEFEQYVRDDAPKALSEFCTQLTALQEECAPDSDVDFKKVALGEMADYLTRTNETEGLTGLPWPWTRMNADTQGMQPGDFILVWAAPKGMKTFWGLIVCAHLFQQGYSVLIYSKEMTWDSLRNRLVCILAKIDYDRLRKGRLSDDEQLRALAAVEYLSRPEHRGRLMFTQADRLDGGLGGPAEIRRKIDTYRPDFVLLDSSYMLELPNARGSALDWTNLTTIMKAIKQIAKSTKCRIMAITQENETQALKAKGSRGTTSLAFNKMAVMDCDLGINLVLNRKKCELSIRYAVMREGKGEGFTINALPCENFEYTGDHLWQVGDDFDDPKAAAPIVQTTAAAQLTAAAPPALSAMERFRQRTIPGAQQTHATSEETDDDDGD